MLLKELVFMEERCDDAKMLQDYGINSNMIKQVDFKIAYHRLSCKVCRCILSQERLRCFKLHEKRPAA